MMISANSQLGLRFSDHALKREFLQLRLDWMDKSIDELKTTIDVAKKVAIDINKEAPSEQQVNQVLENLISEGMSREEAQEWLSGFTMNHNPDKAAIEMRHHEHDLTTLCDDKNYRHYLITKGVEHPSKMIRVGDNFSSTAFQPMKRGNYSYLMGKDEMLRFIVDHPYIRGFYFNSATKNTFEFYFDTKTGEHYLTNEEHNNLFTKVVQLVLFVELGDVEVVVLEQGRNNGKPKKDGKIHNGSNCTVYVVDSSWNQLIIRTEGFAVRGHYKLQPYGPMSQLRKLIWVSAFEKHGYKRRPRAEIVN